MNKKLNIFGRKVPVLAVMMALLVIGTASAAVFLNYATLSGDVEVTTPISVTEAGGESPLAIGGSGNLYFDSPPASFTINNDGTTSVDVMLVTTLMEVTITGTPEEPVETLVEIPTEHLDYFSVVYTETGTATVIDDDVSVPVPASGLMVDVELVTASNVEGTYRVTVAVNPV